MAKTFALIAPVQPVLHQASCSNETIQNAPKHCETQQDISLGSNGVGRVHSLRKFQNDFRAQTCALVAPVQPTLHRISCSNETLPNAPKHYETHQNMSLWSNGVDRVRSLWKIPMRFMARTCALIAPVQPVLHRVSCSNETLPNAPKHYETRQNISLGSNGAGRVHSLWKNSDATLWHELLH
jgi:hypothetical protein